VDGKGVEQRVNAARGGGGAWGWGALDKADGVRVVVIIGNELGG
jgi:hypothetical protein